jgi:hypothetical protein
LQLQKQLEAERESLAALRKAEYKDANVKVTLTVFCNNDYNTLKLGCCSTSCCNATKTYDSIWIRFNRCWREEIWKTIAKTRKIHLHFRRTSKKTTRMRSYYIGGIYCTLRSEILILLLLQTYLSDQDFVAIFQMDREAFGALPEWKRNNEKKKHGLY